MVPMVLTNAENHYFDLSNDLSIELWYHRNIGETNHELNLILLII